MKPGFKRWLVFLLTMVPLLSGCKLIVMVGEGGFVRASSSSTCFSGDACVKTVTDTNYSETFTALASTGWHFVEWKAGGGFLCADSTNPVCVVTNIPLAGVPAAEAVVASNQSFYLMPVFTDELPITDTITVVGKEWAQPDLFRLLSWTAINAVCPLSAGGVCDGTLKGYNLDGWTWANVEDINTLYNHYIGTPELGPGPDSHFGGGFYASFTADGWRATGSNSDSVHCAGWAAEAVNPGVDGRIVQMVDILVFPFLDLATTSSDAPVGTMSSGGGAYFYRLP